MKQKYKKNSGMKRLIDHLKNEFETEENLNYYLFKDFLIARRKYLKYMLEGRSCLN